MISLPPFPGAWIFAVTLTLAVTAGADILEVQNTNNTGAGSLRDTIAAAASGDTIVFRVELNGGTIVLASELAIDKNITIDASTLPEGIRIDGNGIVRHFNVTGAHTLVLDTLTLRNGSIDTGTGSSINAGSSGGFLYLQNCDVIENQASTTNAFHTISSQGSRLTMINCHVGGNRADTTAGVHLQDAEGYIIGCTFSGSEDENMDDATGGALIYTTSAAPGLLTVVNSTITGNLANKHCAGLFVEARGSTIAAVSLINTTITGNAVEMPGHPGPGLAIENDMTAVANVRTSYSILSGNLSSGLDTDIEGALHPDSPFNLIGVGGGLTHGVNGNIVGVINPMLGPLRDNGGPTLTRMPVTGSRAVDTSNAGFPYDQREFDRPHGAAFDIGAVEGVDHSAARAVLSSQISRAQKQLKKAKKSKNKRKIKQARKKLKSLQQQLAALA